MKREANSHRWTAAVIVYTTAEMRTYMPPATLNKTGSIEYFNTRREAVEGILNHMIHYEKWYDTWLYGAVSSVSLIISIE